MIIRNGELADDGAAVFSLDDTDATYGYGCYETLKVRGGVLHFPEFHAERLIESARILGIAVDFTEAVVIDALERLVLANGLEDNNVKILVIGRDGRFADWFAFSLPPIYPPAGSELDGVACLAFSGERHFPQAKSLSMLLSTVAYKTASSLDCYDALLVNHRGEITEGTRTNVFYAFTGDPDVLYTPPARDVLTGITRRTFMSMCEEAGKKIRERPLPLAEVESLAVGLLVSSTSTRLVPVSALRYAGRSDTISIPLVSGLVEAAAHYALWLEGYRMGKKCSH